MAIKKQNREKIPVSVFLGSNIQYINKIIGKSRLD